MHNKIFLLVSFFCFGFINANELVFSNKEISNIYIEPSTDSPIIYPIEMGKEFILKKEADGWIKVLDEKTGLVGWIQKELNRL